MIRPCKPDTLGRRCTEHDFLPLYPDGKCRQAIEHERMLSTLPPTVPFVQDHPVEVLLSGKDVDNG